MTELTPRDVEMITFLQKGFVADTNLLNDLFFHSIKPCHRRLAKLYRSGFLTRGRHDSREPFVYYQGRLPKNVKYALTKTRIFTRFKNSQLTILDYRSNYQLVTLPVDLFLIVETPQHTILPILIDLKLKGTFQVKRMEEAFSNNDIFALIVNTLRQIAPIDNIIIVACAPKNMTSKLFTHEYLRPAQLEEDLAALIQKLEQFN